MVRDQLMRNRVDLYTGHGRFVDAHTVAVEDPIWGRTPHADSRISSSSPPEPHRDGRRASSSTKNGCWTPTGSST